MKIIRNIAIMSLLCVGAMAFDIRMIGGGNMSSTDYIKNGYAIGAEISSISTVRGNGFVYGLRAGALALDRKFESGSSAYLNLDVIYRNKRVFEPYISIGPSYQNLSGQDNGFGYNAGIGMRYVSCKNYMIGVEFNRQVMTYSSNQTATAARDGSEYDNHAILLSVGYRFR